MRDLNVVPADRKRRRPSPLRRGRGTRGDRGQGDGSRVVKRLRWGADLVLGLVAVTSLVACGGLPTGTASVGVPEGDGYVDVQPAGLTTMLAAKDFTFVNVHVPYEGEIEATDLFIPFDRIGDRLEALPDRDAKIVLYCRSGSMSTTAARALVAAGYTNVWNLDGGMNAWRAEGYTVVERPPS